ATDPTLTYTITGFVNGDDEADLDTPVSIARAAGEDVGNYTITPSGAVDANYTISFPTAQFGITKAALTVTANAGQTKVYGATDPTLTFTITGFVNGDDEADLDTPVSIARAAGEDVGNYTITPSGAVDANYTISFPTAQFAITKAALTVTAADKSKYCGQPNPQLTFTYSGWVNGVEAIDTPPVISTTVNVTTTAANYLDSITLSGGLDNNYSFNLVAGTFTVYGVSIDASASSAPVALGSPITLSATVTSSESGDLSGIPVVFTLDNGNGTPIIYPTVLTNSNGLATYSLGGLAVEVYKITAVAGSGCATSTAYLAVYDPSGGFVTGGGWINSPAGAYTANPALTGKANFGFNAKYKKGSTQVDGNTEFQFHTGNLNFSSSSHDAMSLVIAGAQAIYKGKGTINGISGYSFMVSGIDGDKKSTVVQDKFRIKIWNAFGTVYDNQIGAADNADAITALGGGSIVIHEVKKNNAKTAEVVEKVSEQVPFNVIAYPNPAKYQFTLVVEGGSKEKIEVVLYDVLGRTVKKIESTDGQPIVFGEELPAGSYFTIVNQGANKKTIRLIKQ
ncbi:Por secretion system C-terminal sorting domain-containing protein, partial [Flavobacterium fluvii]